MKAYFSKYILYFKQPSGTSRGILTQKETYFLHIEKDGKTVIGECGILRSLSADDQPNYEQKLQWTCQNIHLGKDILWNELLEFPSIQFGLEQAFIQLETANNLLFETDFTKGKKGIPINGLVWMGSSEFMLQQISEKIEQGFKCIKMKIGALDFETEFQILKKLRTQFSEDDIEIRVDANGAFQFNETLEKLNQLSQLKIHSIEQPIKAGNWEKMAILCEKTPLPIALDEELIGVFNHSEKEKLIHHIKPQYIILKPSFIGGYKGSEEWISLAKKHQIGWWITSALESNIGLNAIAQWTFTLQNSMPQGLGTGGLFTNNFPTSLCVKNGTLWFSN